MSRKATYYRSASVAALVVASSLVALSGNVAAEPFTVNFDENGNITCNVPGCSFLGVGPDPLTRLGAPPIPGNVLMYSIPSGPVGASNARIGINNASGQLSDALAFTRLFGGIGGIPGGTPANTMVFYSFDNFGSLADLAGGLPAGINTSNTPIRATEAPDGSFTIGPILPNPNTFNGMSDVAAPNEKPLPPAIYLFGSILGGAFWMSRRKRTAVSSLGVP